MSPFLIAFLKLAQREIACTGIPVQQTVVFFNEVLRLQVVQSAWLRLFSLDFRDKKSYLE